MNYSNTLMETTDLTEEQVSLNNKLIHIQSELKAPKNQRNNFGGYNYRSCEDIMESVKPILEKYGVSLVVSDDIIEVGGRIYVKATATLSNGYCCISNSAFAREAEAKKGMDESQITGAASSYARKYALNGLFCIDDTKDADATNTHGKDQTPQEKAKATREANKKTEEELKEKAEKTIAWLKTLTRDLTQEESIKIDSLLNQLSAEKYLDYANEIAAILMNKDEIGV